MDDVAGTVTGNTNDGLIFAGTLICAALLDALVRPRPAGNLRNRAGMWLSACMMSALFGLFLAVCGNVPVSAGLALGLLALLVLASNAKHAMLGEPLLFSDLALLGAIFRHPQFYLSAVTIWQRVLVVLGAGILLATLAWLFVPSLAEHLAGAGLLLVSLALLTMSIRIVRPRDLAPAPDAYCDVRRFGLLPTIFLYWLRWRDTQNPPPCEGIQRHAASDAPEVLVVVQCESFADPIELFGDPALALSGLTRARESAWQWGRLNVSGFGAYTMRTEYGVLFGRDEEVLGFRRYDPFLTALGEASYALPAQLLRTGWCSHFLHPHDMRFYGRDSIMPAGGFAELIGQDRFAPPKPGEGRYVTDAEMADQIAALAGRQTGPALYYAVTIENHGPWAPDRSGTSGDLVSSYMRLVRNSDAMLITLMDRLKELGRPAMLVFFGDHRPSIPGATAPGGDRHTPYVMLRIDSSGGIVRGDNREVDLTPAELHHAMLNTVLGEPAGNA